LSAHDKGKTTEHELQRIRLALEICEKELAEKNTALESVTESY
jgi:hypothetical protein